MSVQLWMLVGIIIAVVGYWAIRRVRPAGAFVLLCAALLGTVGLLEWLQRPDYRYVAVDEPIAVIVVVDLSMGMGARPSPLRYPDFPTRLERANAVLLDLIAAWQEQQYPIVAGLIGFKATAEVIAGWDRDLDQLRQAIDFVIVPRLLPEPGTDLASPLRSMGTGGRLAPAPVDSLFDSLPMEVERRAVILVADGEHNTGPRRPQEFWARLRADDVAVVSLQTGLLDEPEGLLEFDDDGTFTGFLEVGGERYTLADPVMMRQIAGADPTRGLHVRAEDPQAAQQILEFIGGQPAQTTSTWVRTTAIWTLWGLSCICLVRMLI